MKKTLVILALAMISFANAQKGTVLVSGGVSFYSDKNSSQDSEDSHKYVGFNPKVGYQFKDNWTVGVESEFSSRKDEYTNQEFTSKYVSAGAFVRYSKSLSQLFLLYADLGTGYKGTKETNNYSISTLTNSTIKFDGFYMNFAPGLFLNIKNNFGLNFGIGGLTYSNTKSDQNNRKNSNFYFNFGTSFNVGISKNF
jgi:hypothetical protein